MWHLESIPADSRSREKGSLAPSSSSAGQRGGPARSFSAFSPCVWNRFPVRFVQAGPTGVPGSARGGPCEAAIRMQEGGSRKLIFLT